MITNVSNKITMEEVFYDALKEIDQDMLKHIKTNVSIFYKIPTSEINKMKFTELKNNFVNILYYNKKQKEQMNNG